MKDISTIKGLEQMDKFAQEFCEKYLKRGGRDRAILVLLSGDLGSGKTTFTRSLAGVFGIRARVTSPTFVIEKRYAVKNKKIPFKQLVHIDAYRLEGDDVDETLGLEETLSDPDNLVVVEWPENIKNFTTDFDLKLSFEFVDEDVRKILLEKG